MEALWFINFWAVMSFGSRYGIDIVVPESVLN